MSVCLLLMLAAYPIACLILSILSSLWTVKLSIISRTISHHSLESMALAGLHFSVYSCFLPAKFLANFLPFLSLLDGLN
jgi:hypothetical protein